MSENLSFLEPVGDDPHCPALFFYLVCNQAALKTDRARHGERNDIYTGLYLKHFNMHFFILIMK